MSNENLKFWTILAWAALATAIMITLIDLTIKTAILEDSNALKKTIWEERRGKGTEVATDSGNTTDPIHNGVVPGDLLDTDNARMEAGNVSNGTKGTDTGSKTRTAKPRNRARSAEIPPAN